MRGIYTAQISISGLAAARTLIYGTAPSNRLIEVLETLVENQSNETNEQLNMCWQKITTLGTPTKTDITPRQHETGDQAAASTWAGNVTASEPTYGAGTQLWPRGVPSLTGYNKEPQPETRVYISGGDTWGFRNLAAMTAADVIVSVTFREVG